MIGIYNIGTKEIRRNTEGAGRASVCCWNSLQNCNDIYPLIILNANLIYEVIDDTAQYFRFLHNLKG
jgi:hypothetical protein